MTTENQATEAASEVVADAAPQQIPGNKELVFNVTVDEANILLGGLGELPAKVSVNLINKLQQQAQAQF